MTLDPFAHAFRHGLVALMSLTAAGAAGAGVMFLFSCLGGPIGMLIGIVAAPFWLVGAITVGAPLWAALHAAGRRTRFAARLSGAGAAGLCAPLVLLLFIADSPTSAPDLQMFGLLTAIGVAAAISGAVAGNVAWSLGYGGRYA